MRKKARVESVVGTSTECLVNLRAFLLKKVRCVSTCVWIVVAAMLIKYRIEERYARTERSLSSVIVQSVYRYPLPKA